jgi:hypothetical protein
LWWFWGNRHSAQLWRLSFQARTQWPRGSLRLINDLPQETRRGVLGDGGAGRSGALRCELRTGMRARRPPRVTTINSEYNLQTMCISGN